MLNYTKLYFIFDKLNDFIQTLEDFYNCLILFFQVFMIAIYFWFPLFIFIFFSLITQNIGGGILFLLMYIIIIKLFNQNLINDKLKNLQNINNLNLIRHNLPLNQQNELSKIDNIGFDRSYFNFKNLERDSMKENVVKLSQISLKKWFLVIILLMILLLSVFYYSVSDYLFWTIPLIVCYYGLIGAIYLISRIIDLIYNSKVFQKTEQNTQNIQNKADNNSPQQTGIGNKIKSNLVSKWHFWTILVFNFLINWGIITGLIGALILQIILSTNSPVEILPIYLSLLIFGSFLALIFFGIKNRINSILLSSILTISLFWSLGNAYFVNTNFNLVNFSTCQDFGIFSDREFVKYSDKEYKSTTFIGNIERVDNQIEIRISQYSTKDFKTEKIGEISKLDKIKSCLIPTFENQKVILIEEKIKEESPEFPFPLINPSLPLPKDLPINLPSNLPPIPKN